MAAIECSQGSVNDNCRSAQSFCSLGAQQVNQNPIDINLSSIANDKTTLVTATIWNRIRQVLENIYNYGKRGTRNPTGVAPTYAFTGNYSPQTVYCTGGFQKDCYMDFYDDNLCNVNGTQDICMINIESMCPGQTSQYMGGGSGGYSGCGVSNFIVYERSNSLSPYTTQTPMNQFVSVSEATGQGAAVNINVPVYAMTNAGMANVNIGDSIELQLYNNILSKINCSPESGTITITKQLMDELQNLIGTYKLNSNRCNSCNTACNTECQADCQSCNSCQSGQGGDSGGGGGTCFCAQYTCGQQYYDAPGCLTLQGGCAYVTM